MSVTYFFAIFPDVDARDLAYAEAGLFKASLNLRGRLVARERLHLTCHFVGRFVSSSIEVEAKAITVGEGIVAKPCEIEFNHALSLDSSGLAPCVFAPTVVPRELKSLAEELRGATRNDVPDPMRTFHPRVTWLRSQDRIYGTLPMSPLTWPIRSFSLAAGVAGEPAYRIVRTWVLT
ncbi:MAG: hypothetical protein ABI843_02905 [Dokdonella sp.]